MVKSQTYIRISMVIVLICGAISCMPALSFGAESSVSDDGATNTVHVLSVGSSDGQDASNQSEQTDNLPAVVSSAAPATSTINWKRVWGETALDTMAEISQEGWSSSPVVVIATKDHFMDALSASSLAGYYKAPILLTAYNKLSSQTKEEIIRLKAQTAYIVGGPLAIHETVADQIKKAGCSNIIRVWGDHGQDTAREVASKIGSAVGKVCFVATDARYQDALSASPYAYATKSPIFLSSKNGAELDQKTINAIVQGAYSEVIILGGPGAISQNVETQLANSGVKNVKRLWGQNSEGTSSLVAAWALEHGMKPNKVGIATSKSFQDALTGAALCGKNNAPIVLASATNRSVTYTFLNPNRSNIKRGYIFGGRYAVNPETASIIQDGTTPAVYSNLEGHNAAGFTKVGIDVSQWQKSIDWKKVQESGVDFAILRVGYGDNLTKQDDKFFLEYVKGAKEVGIPIGVYIYSYATTVAGATNEAAHMLRLLQEAGLSKADVPFGVFYDLEEPGLQKIANRSLLLNMSKTFCDAITRAGYTPGIYANLNWWNNYLPSVEYNKWTRWMAQYNTSCTYFGAYKIWQFSSTGKVPGISGNVDMNLYY